MTAPDIATAEELLLPMIFGPVQGQLVRVAVELGVPDLLASGPQTLADLAVSTGTQPKALARVLRALAQFGVVADAGPDRYAASEVSELLRLNTAHTFNHYARMNNNAWLLQVVAELGASTHDGTPAGARVLGTEVYAYLQAHPVAAAEFNAALTELSAQDARALLGAYEFGQHTEVIDVGGGEGAFVRALLDAHPRLTGVVLDFEAVVARAPAVLGPHLASGRARILAVDFRVEIPAGADLYVLKRVVSTVTTSDIEAGLRNIRAVMPAHGRLLIADPDPDTRYGALLDVLMLVATGGGLRSRAQLDALLGAAGFRIERQLDAGATLCAYLAEPV